MKPIIAIVHNSIGDESLPDEQDVLIQASAVSRAMEGLGYRSVMLPCGLNLEALGSRLEEIQPEMVFNLVESLGGKGRLIHLVPAFLESLCLPYTGSPAEAIHATSHKVMAKERMRTAGLPTADWINPAPPDLSWPGGVSLSQEISGMHGGKPLWIIKSLWEHASLGLEAENLVAGTAQEISKLLPFRSRDLGGACFAERFISGREFNLSLLETGEEVMLLPPAEILFQGGETEKPKLVGYKAKWDPESADYRNTPRSFEFSENDGILLTHLKDLAFRCWQCFGLRGYARVDFRVDENNNPMILEVNANPCISPDAGFSAALSQAGIPYETAIQEILKHHC